MIYIVYILETCKKYSTTIKHENKIALHVPTCDRQNATNIVFKSVKIGRNLLESTFCRQCKEEMKDVDIYTIWRGTDNLTIKISIQKKCKILFFGINTINISLTI